MVKHGHFFDSDNNVMPVEGMYRGMSAFLVCGGPSLATMDLSLIRKPGILSMSLNNAIKVFRGTMWASVDDPANFIRSAWYDPTILKFVRACHLKPDRNDPDSKKVFNSDKWEFTNVQAKDCPSTIWWHHSSVFKAETFLTEATIAWGDESEDEAKKDNTWSKDRLYGGRSVMLAAIKILHLLGIKNVYIIGADFHMRADKKYAFEQDRHEGSLAGNNAQYVIQRERYRQLRPIFEAAGFNVYNCTPGSQLVELKAMDYADAAARCLVENRMDIDLASERTEGLYDRKDKIKREAQEKKVTIEPAAAKPDEEAMQREIEAEIQKAIDKTRAKYAAPEAASERTYQKLVGTDDVWREVPFADLTVGDRIKVWRDKARKDRVKIDGSKEFTILAIKDGALSLAHWERSTHINFLKSGTLLDEIKKQTEAV